MENQDARLQSRDELDMTQFFRWIRKGIVNAGKTFIYSLASLRRIFLDNRMFFAVVILFGIMLGALYSELLKKKFYKTTMVLSCDYLNTQILENTIDKLNLLAREDEREGLSDELKIDRAIAKNIQEFGFQSFVSEDDIIEMEVLRTQLNTVAADKKDIVEKVIDKLVIENKNAYEISVMVYNPEIVKPLEKALVNYFASNEYIKRRIEINKMNLHTRKTKLTRESSKLDSLKDVIFQNYQNFGKASKGSNNVILGEDKLTNPLDVFKQDLEINDELMTIERNLYIQPDFEVVEGFTTFKEPESASLSQILITSFFASFAMGYLIIGAWKFDQLLATYSNPR